MNIRLGAFGTRSSCLGFERLKSILACLLVVFLGLVMGELRPMACWAKETPELLRNGSFEALATDGSPESWNVRTWLGDSKFASCQIVTNKPRFGQRCLQLRSTAGPILYGCFSHPVSLDTDSPPAHLLLTLYYRTEGMPVADVAVNAFAEDFSEKEWQTPVLSSDAFMLQPSPQWRSLTCHLGLLPSTRQIIVFLRLHSAGTLYVDGISLKPYPGDIACELLTAGTLLDPKGTRRGLVRLTNQAKQEQPVRLSLMAQTPKGPRVLAETSVRLRPGQREEAMLKFTQPPDLPLSVRLLITDDKKEQIYDELSYIVPGLLDGHIVAPAFRGTILSRVPLKEIIAQGAVNASTELRRQLTLKGRLVGLGLELPEIGMDEQGQWRVAAPISGLLTGQYAVEIQALLRGQPLAELKLPLHKPAPQGGEAAYDERMHLWLNGKRIFPLGIFMILDETDARAVAEAGFNTIVLSSRVASSALMEIIEKLGLATVLSSANMDRDFWKNQIARFSRSESLAGLYVLQRPESQIPPVPPETMAVMYRGLCELDPRHPICLAIGSLTQMQAYEPACDILMPWTEPEPAGDLRAVDIVLQRALQLCSGRKPVWAIIPLAGAAHMGNGRLDPAGSGRPPSPAEYRCMAYLAIARGAQGLFAYAYRLPASRERRDYWAPREAPQLWETAKKINEELKVLSPIILEGESVTVSGDNSALAWGGFLHRETFYIFVVNPLATTQEISLRVPNMRTNQLEAVFNGEKFVGAEPGNFHLSLPPYAAFVLMGR